MAVFDGRLCKTSCNTLRAARNLSCVVSTLFCWPEVLLRYFATLGSSTSFPLAYIGERRQPSRQLRFLFTIRLHMARTANLLQRFSPLILVCICCRVWYLWFTVLGTRI